MTHYICTGGCDGGSDLPGLCQAEDCAKEGQPLVPCDCADGAHQKKEEGETESELT